MFTGGSKCNGTEVQRVEAAPARRTNTPELVCCSLEQFASVVVPSPLRACVCECGSVALFHSLSYHPVVCSPLISHPVCISRPNCKNCLAI